MESYKFGEMSMGVYDFWLKELADVYIEAIKPVMKGTDEEAKKAARNTLFRCLDSGLRLLHPIMPYLTEELFQRLPHREGPSRPESICIATFPTSQKSYDTENVEDKLNQVMNAVKAFRSQLAALNVPKSANPQLAVRCRSEDWKTVFASAIPIIQSLVKCSTIDVMAGGDSDPEGSLRNHVNEDIQTYIKVVGLIDIKLEIDRIKKRQNELKKLMDDLQKKMNVLNYETKVPENVRNENSKKFTGYETEFTEAQKSQAILAQFL
jgi:valyl-tRNA synthetase